MAARLCECAGNAALYSLKGCTWWCGSDFSIKLFKKHPRLSLLAGLQLLDLWSPATVAGPQGVPLPVLLAVLDSVVSLRFCPNTCRSCHVQSARGPSWGQSSGLHLKRRGLDLRCSTTLPCEVPAGGRPECAVGSRERGGRTQGPCLLSGFLATTGPSERNRGYPVVRSAGRWQSCPESGLGSPSIGAGAWRAAGWSASSCWRHHRCLGQPYRVRFSFSCHPFILNA